MKKLFFETKMTWFKVIVLSIISGVAAGLLLIPAALKGTSFQQPGISFEFWIFSALFIILNCEKPLEAGLKTFVFFLISQPLIYLVQVPVASLHWQLFNYYPRWGIYTLLTFPGAMLAWNIKKGRWIDIIILNIANVLLCMMLPPYFKSVINNFPKELIAIIFIIFQLVMFTYIIFDDKKKRIISYAIIIIILGLVIGNFVREEKIHNGCFETELEGVAPFEVVSEYYNIDVTIEDDILKIHSFNYCNQIIVIKDAEGEEREYLIDNSKDGFDFTLLE